MAEIILTDEQLQLIAKARGEIEFRDENGNCVGYFHRSVLAPDKIAEAENRLQSDGPWHTTSEVVNHLHSLEDE